MRMMMMREVLGGTEYGRLDRGVRNIRQCSRRFLDGVFVGRYVVNLVYICLRVGLA